MNFEQVTAYLEEKFGVILDWTSETVLPTLKELAHRIATYNIVKDSVVIVICGAIFTITAIFFTKEIKAWIHKDYNNWYIEEEHEFDDWSHPVLTSLGFGFTAIFALLSFLSAAFFIACSVDLMKWIFIPEIQLFDYIKDLMA